MTALAGIEVVYAEAGRAWRQALWLEGTPTVADALAALRRACPGWPAAALAPAACAVYGRPVLPETPLRHGDRLELLRPLPTDPKRARRERAAATKTPR
ncbi:RnfH family protein [Silanimonas lenta]|uniref:RnfH family protein n=1 Tax=Silanimonas lenta TaxID=265429 RepID=UPI0003FBB0EA|nr:RnfH family protein [Silanimonas lenta]